MKKEVLVIALSLSAFIAKSQSVGVGTTTPNSSAALDVVSTNKGFLQPRVSLTSETDAVTIPSPATSLLVYNTNTAMPAGVGHYYNAGTATQPKWTRLLGVAGSSSPVNGQTIIWNGTTYVTGYPQVAVAPGTPISGNGNTATPITINTASPVYNSNKIQSRDVSTTAPSNAQVLIWNGTQYVPGPVNAVQIQGRVVNNAAPTNGQTLVYNATTNEYAPGTAAGDNWGTQTVIANGPAITGNGTPASPLTFGGINTTGTPLSGVGTSASPLSINTALPVYNSNSIQSKPVSTTAPANAQVLVWNGTEYVPSVVNAVQIQGRTVNNAAPTNGQTLVWNSTTNQYVPGTVAGDNWGTQSVVANGPALTGNGTTATPLNVNTGLAIYNANAIQGRTVNNTAPTNGQTLVWNSTTNQYGPGNAAGDNWGTQTVAVTGVVTGNGTAGSPVGVNTTVAVYNANSIQGKTVSTTAPSPGQTLVWNGTNYTPTTIAPATSGNGVTVTNSVVNLGGTLNADVNFPMNGKNVIFNSTTNGGKVSIGNLTAPTNTLHVKGTDPVRIEGISHVGNSASLKQVVIDGNGVLKTVDNVLPAVKVLALTSASEQDLNTSTFNSGNHINISFLTSDIDANLGSSVTFNQSTQEFTITEAGAYAVDGYLSYSSGGGCGAHPVSIALKKNGVIITGARMVYTDDMANAGTETSIQGLSFHNVLSLAAGDKLTLWIKKPSGATPPDPRIKKTIDIPESKRFSITRL